MFRFLQIRFFFPHLQSTGPLNKELVDDVVMKRPVATVTTPMGSVPKTLHNVLVEGLTELCKVSVEPRPIVISLFRGHSRCVLDQAKPAGLDAVEFLGRWLLANNPRRGLAVAPGGEEGLGLLSGSGGAIITMPDDGESYTSARSESKGTEGGEFSVMQSTCECPPWLRCSASGKGITPCCRLFAPSLYLSLDYCVFRSEHER